MTNSPSSTPQSITAISPSRNSNMSSTSPAQQAFEQALQAFRNKVQNPALYEEILRTTTIVDVYKETAKIQARLAPEGKLRHLARIKPFLDRISAYATVIDTFAQAKPELLAVIWGPIRLILLWSSQISTVLEKVADTLVSIGNALPQFATMSETFTASEVVKAALVLFYEDILDFYGITLDFFRKTRWKQFFDIIWPKYQKQIDAVVANLEKHSSLMRTEVTFLDIKEAREARVRSYEHFTKAEAAQELQKYFSLKSRVSPNLQDDRLDWLRNRSVSGCATWLFQDERFVEWLDTSKAGSVWLWLQGIPGAGKTYLTAAAIEHMREQHRVLFAFVAHANKGSLLALSIIHSLMFQAAEDDKGFRSVLIEAKEREVQGNTGYAADLLKTFLVSAGPVYIIIDGIDEMEYSERHIVLQRLGEISKDCADLRLLISSRAEADISRVLLQKATTIRVDEGNSGGIQTYVDKRFQDWMNSHEFNQETRLEFLNFISPLSAKAKGMFLYARIVLDDLEQMNSIGEIRSELKALPNDLADAYHRIFLRINNLKPQLRAKCRKVLGWIGCAPVPLTTLEMEQALSVDPGSQDEADQPPQLIVNISFVQMCGPIIEAVDEELQFVHFTVYEYIFSKDIQSYIDQATATQELTSTFLAYLSLTIMDIDLDDEDINGNILTGKYRLFNYVSSFWPTLFHRASESRSGSDDLKTLLERVLQRGRNHHFKSDTENSETFDENIYRRNTSPETLTMICKTFQFHLNDKRWDWNWDNSNSWINFDPLNTSQLLLRIQEQHETLSLDLEHAKTMQTQYGSRLFRCTYLFCEHDYRWFETLKDRNAHINNHGKPWKCSVVNCDFSTIGFSSKARRDKHWLKVHLPAPSQLTDDFDNLDVTEAQPMLFALVIEDDADGTRRLLSCPGGKKLKPEVIASARGIAAKKGSLAITQILAPENETYAPQPIITSAIRSKDVEFAGWAISKANPEDCVKIMKAALGTNSEEIYTLWEDYLLESTRLKSWQRLITETSIFCRPLFADVKGNPMKEDRIKHTLRKFEGRMPPSTLGSILLNVARSCCSLSLVQELLALGAPIDYPNSHGGRGMTALHVAAKKTTKEAALLSKYLILKGASTYSKVPGSYDLGDEKGARGIATWVGMTWEELREQYARSSKTIVLD
ncbi:hypothetical protein BGZ63DRAFT_389893 [Mariannaea sp. PMI_226]|nr:hypothetical protein BGZ63DRAFT_389893 [Mariannaea sp. PMI_226]